MQETQNPTIALVELGAPYGPVWHTIKADEGWEAAFMLALELHEITGLPVRILEVSLVYRAGTMLPLCEIHCAPDGILRLSPLRSAPDP